jgi:hypothetical protein
MSVNINNFAKERKQYIPNPLQPPWAQLIPLIPVADHSVSVGTATWQPDLAQHGLHNHFDAIFDGNQVVRLSRGRLQNHAYPNNEQKCLEILMWGYPARNRGNLRQAFLQNIHEIAALAPENQQWHAYYNALHTLGDLGISTITKLAYFYGHRFGDLPGLILDSRVIRTLAGHRWQGLALPHMNYNNAVTNYDVYLKTVSNIAGQLQCAPDKIELLLFSWGEAFSDGEHEN